MSTLRLHNQKKAKHMKLYDFGAFIAIILFGAALLHAPVPDYKQTKPADAVVVGE